MEVTLLYRRVAALDVHQTKQPVGGFGPGESLDRSRARQCVDRQGAFAVSPPKSGSFDVRHSGGGAPAPAGRYRPRAECPRSATRTGAPVPLRRTPHAFSHSEPVVLGRPRHVRGATQRDLEHRLPNYSLDEARLPRTRHRPHGLATRRAIGASSDQVLTPLDAVLSTPIIPLDHHLPRRARRVKAYMGKQRITRCNTQPAARSVEIVLTQPRRQRRPTCAAPRIRRRIRSYPEPCLVETNWKSTASSARPATPPSPSSTLEFASER